METNTIKSNAMKINTTTRSFLQGILAAALLLLAALPANLAASELTGVARQVRHELVMLPYYGVFDNLEFRVDGSKVSLHGQVHRPSLKKDAERVVQKLESVESVENQIEVLPTSNQDDRIRSDVFRAVYYHPSFTRYAIRAVPPIHILAASSSRTATSPWSAPLPGRPTRTLPLCWPTASPASSRSRTTSSSKSKKFVEE